MDRQQQLLTNMHTFSIAAKYLSFTKAAEELYVSQGAISQRIKQLEQQLGFNLFVRLTRRLALTDEGQRLLTALTQSFDLIFSEIDDIKFNELSGELYLGVAPTFAQSWLLKRIKTFRDMYPKLNIRLRVKASELNFDHEPVDIAIYYSEGKHRDFHCQKLFDEYLTPICTPSYFKHHFNSENDSYVIKQPLTLIHCTESLGANQPHYEWSKWLRNQKQSAISIDISSQLSIQLNHADMAISACCNDMGIAIGRVGLVQDKLISGELIAPFERVSANRGYYLICPTGQQSRPRNLAFIDWIAENTITPTNIT